MNKRRHYLILFIVLFGLALWGLVETVLAFTPTPVHPLTTQQ